MMMETIKNELHPIRHLSTSFQSNMTWMLISRQPKTKQKKFQILFCKANIYDYVDQLMLIVLLGEPKVLRPFSTSSDKIVEPFFKSSNNI